MSKQSSLNRRRSEQAAETRQIRLISIAIGVGALIVIAAIAYFAWPKIVPVTELKVEDLVVGTGREARSGDSLSVEYTGWLQAKYDSEPFDSANLHDGPFEFVLGKGNVIEGWDQGLVGMKVGGKRKLTVPPNLGYGADGAMNGRIPPNSALIFEVSLLDVKDVPPTALPLTSVTELKIEDLVIGTGAEAKAGDTLSMHYTGWLEDGTKFDSSLDRNQPIEFVLGHGDVIAGWDKGILGMKVGGKRRLTIPPALGYGTSGAGSTIPPNATLIFEVELVAIK